MIKSIRIMPFFVIFLLGFFSSQLQKATAYDGSVHIEINKHATEQSNLDNYLKNQLGFPKGIEEIINGDEVKKWITDGGETEDYGWFGEHDYPRSRGFNHFHDPLKNWDEAGLDHEAKLIYKGNYLRDPVSSILWGLKPGEQDFFMNFTGDWSWGAARYYYYHALTAPTEDERQENLADCLRAVGQLMHLVQDVSVPLHTRNDPHVLPAWTGKWTYETYANKNKDKLNYSAYHPAAILLTDPNPDGNYSHLVPITGLFDRNKYKKDGPIYTGKDIGLAEYSNANFLTQDTMWTYPHPSRADTDYDRINWLNPEPIDAEDGKTDHRIYIKFKEGVGEDIKHLAAVDYWTIEYEGSIAGIIKAFSLDEKCWEDYASKLIPRAVGYSAGVLDYFFRGKIELSRKAYAQDAITLFARNITDGAEQMSGGTVKLVVKYRLNNDVFYIVADEKGGSSSLVIPRDNGIELSFDLRNNPIPAGAKDIALQVVYRGKLGKEIDGGWIGETDAVAVGMTPYVLFIVLHKKTGDTTDWWYYDLDKEEGYHKNPNVPLPSKPEIISKWWTCENLEEVEKYTRATPALQAIATGGCGDDCGLIHFNDQCCSGPSSIPNEFKRWGTCPCGGKWTQGVYDWHCSVAPFECQGGKNIGDPFREGRALAGCDNNYNRTSNLSRPCPKGKSWGLSVGDLTEQMDIGPRGRTSGYESKTTCTVHSAKCGPYPYSRRCCNSWKDTWEDPCRAVGGDTWLGCCGKWDPYDCGTECKEGYDQCTNWFVREPGGSGPAAWRWSGYTHYGSPVSGGCLVFTSESKSAGYSTEKVPLITRVKVGEVETLFEGSWDQYTSSPATASSVKRRDGYANSCQPCQKETLGSSSYSQASYTYSETSYGISGWYTTVLGDGRFAVLLPRLELTASATSIDGEASGSISGPTTALLRIVDIVDENPVERDFELAEGEKGYSLSGMPGSRDDLGIKPNCWPLDLPLDIELKGFHWYGDNAFLVVFILQDVFYAYLLEKKKDTGWQETRLQGFEQWVSENKLEGHLMFLN